jgi:hypothetical protein
MLGLVQVAGVRLREVGVRILPRKARSKTLSHCDRSRKISGLETCTHLN